MGNGPTACETEAVLAEKFSDPQNARLIFLAAGGLFLLAVAIVVGTVWWWRSSGIEHRSLAPLEVMGKKNWQLADDLDRADQLNSVRLHDGADHTGSAGLRVGATSSTSVRGPRRQARRDAELDAEPGESTRRGSGRGRLSRRAVADDEWGADEEDPLYSLPDDEAAVDDDERFLDEEGDEWWDAPPQRRRGEPPMPSDELW